MDQFKVKFFGTKVRKGVLSKQSLIVEAASTENVEDVLRRKGWLVIHGLKIRKA